MLRFREKCLNEILKEFDNRSMIEIEFENNLSGSILLKDANIKYDEKLGFINIKGRNIKLKINTTLIYRYEKDKNSIKIELESLVIYIKKDIKYGMQDIELNGNKL